jgi:IS5 family transposase
MLQHRYQQRSVWEGVLPDADKLWPEDLRRIDAALEDETVIEIVTQALQRRWPRSRTRGRKGTPAEVVLRMLLLKHLYRWSYDELEREVRSNLVFREFARVGCEKVPDAKTILKIAQVLGGEVIEKLHRRVVDLAVRAGVSQGRRLRIDTTVVETNVHYPTDSSLMMDGSRVMTRVVKRVEKLIGRGRKGFRSYLRSIKRRCIEIRMQARSEKKKAERVVSYRKLMGLTRKVIRESTKVVRRVTSRLSRGGDPERVRRKLEKAKESSSKQSSECWVVIPMFRTKC